MGYQQKDGRYARTRDVAFKGIVATVAGALAATVTELGEFTTLRLTLNATAVSGTTPSATVTVETSPDGSTGWVAVGSFTAVTAVGSQRKVFAGCDRFYRLNVTAVSGTTPSVTFDVTGDAC